MEDKMYTITLADGTVVDNLSMNGNNYISNAEIKESVFENNCAPVIISDGETEETHTAMALIHVTKMDGTYWFALRDRSASELEKIKMQSDIAYIAMMSGVEL